MKKGIYRHFKGAYYRVLVIAEHTETSEEMVIYTPVKGKFKVYCRPASMFNSPVDKSKYPDVNQKNRFEFIK